MDLKVELLRLVAEVAGRPGDRADGLLDRVGAPHMTLEVLFSMLRYRCGEAFRPTELWSALCRGVTPNRLSRAIAALRREALVGTLVTTNFDVMLQDAATRLGAEEGRDFRVLTEWQLDHDGAIAPTSLDICHVHGTVYEHGDDSFAPPISATARGLVRPFTPGMHRYLSRLVGPEQSVVVLGYSGQDHYDVNPWLGALRRSRPRTFDRWLWVSHTGDAREVERVARLLGPDRVVVADATGVLTEVCSHLGLGVAAGDEEPGWRERLADIVRGFDLPVGGARRFLDDLGRNLAGAWVTLEHYRIFSAGYTESTALEFGGIEPADGAPTGGGADHLAYLEEPWTVPYGQLLEGQYWYWNEDREHVEADAPDATALYRRSSAVFAGVQARLADVLARAPRGELRPEDRALLLVGRAVAEDYLGLIERKRGLLVEAERPDRWAAAVRHFEACRDHAQAAGRTIGDPDGDRTATAVPGLPFAEDLVQHRMWVSIAQANLARTLDDREDATAAYVQVIELMSDMIDRERSQAATSPDRGLHDDYLIALYPQLWLRASEMLKTVLECSGNTATPCSWDDLTGAERDHAEMALRVCEEAYTAYTRLTSLLNSRYAARYEAAILFHASRAMSRHTLSLDDRREARARFEATVREFSLVASRNPDVRPDWARNIRRRIDRLPGWP